MIHHQNHRSTVRANKNFMKMDSEMPLTIVLLLSKVVLVLGIHLWMFFILPAVTER